MPVSLVMTDVAATPRLSAMVRTALFVNDLDASTRFYQDVLGINEVFFEGDLSEGNAHRLLGVPSTTATRARILKVAGPAFGMVGLFELRSPSPPPVRKDPAVTNAGETCLVFYCSDLDPIVDRLKAAGHRILCEPLRFQVGEQTKQREMSLRDPDDVMINLIEWDPEDERKPELQTGTLEK